MSVKPGDKVVAKCLHCEQEHNWVVAMVKDCGAVRIDRVGDGPDCGCFRQVVKPDSILGVKPC